MIEIEQVYKTYEADGEQREWTFPYPYVTQENISLYIEHDGTLTKINPSLYQFSPSTSKVTYPLDPESEPVPAGDTVLIWRETDITQEEDSTVANFKSNDVERMVDKLTMICQELSDKYSRAVHFEPTDVYDTDATTYVKTITDARDIAIQKAGESSESAEESEASSVKSKKWAEGTDQEVAAIGGTKSSKGWAAVAQAAAESPAVQTVAENIEDVNTVAGISTDVSTVSSIHSKVSTVADDITNIDAVVDNKTNIDTVANNIANVNDVAAIKNDVTTVAGNSANVTTVATNVSDVNAVADDITKVTSVADDLSNIDTVKNNLTEINDVNDNKANINAVAANATNINTVAADKTNIDAVAGNATNINTVATNISDVNDVAEDITKVSAVADDLTAINAVNSNKTNIDTVATNISNVTNVAASIADVAAVADDLTNIDNVADDLTNIDTVAASLPDIQDKQNKVLTNSVILGGETQTTVEGALEAISEEWVKPADWVDIRSGAIDNSIYFLVGHSVDYSTYNLFPITCAVSNSGTFDVFIDGFKVATASNDYFINWQELALDTGFDITYPETLRAHIVRITPTLNTNKFTQVRAIYTGAGYTDVGLLWAHFEIDYEISLYMFASTFSTQRAHKLEAITAKGDLLKTSSCYHSFYRCYRLKKTPVFDCTNTSSATGFFANCESIKNIKLKNFTATIAGSLFLGCVSLEKIESEGSKFSPSNAFNSCFNLQQIPPLSIDNTESLGFAMGAGLKDTYLDLSQYTKTTRLSASGTLSNKILGLKSAIVSNEAPFNNSTSPQIDVRHTGLSRAALVNLFKSMPYNVGYTVVGNPTITDGVASGFSNSNYLTISPMTAFDFNNDFEMNCKFTLGEDSVYPAPILIGGGSYYGGIRIQNNRKINFVCRDSVASELYILASENLVSAGNTYEINAKRVSGILTLTIYKNNVLDETITDDVSGKNFTQGIHSEFVIGYQSSLAKALVGSVDLTHTYMNSKGVPWFRGTAAMTKTCSIVGCTGTADLTAEDKAIATDKGWALTLS